MQQHKPRKYSRQRPSFGSKQASRTMLICASVAVRIPVETVKPLCELNNMEYSEFYLSSTDLHSNVAGAIGEVTRTIDCLMYRNILKL